MSRPSISIKGVGKRYRLGERHGARNYRMLRDAISQGARSLARWCARRGEQPAPATKQEAFWALRDISFDVQEGEVIGVIGRNGAGKSTLLKVLSQITEPTEGEIHLGGRLASLLEVGTGFHPELTGRENVYLNGAILGMTHAEIRRKFDDIVAFAEVEKFLDTPVKRYSSGMYVRLAFAVAAHLEPELLVVDEVLAVGDAEFQRRCLGKMKDVASQGRTILFVSHNMAAISNLCHSAVLLSQGRLEATGRVQDVVAQYLSVAAGSGDIDLQNAPGRSGNGAVRFVRAATSDPAGNCKDSFTIGEDIVFSFNLQAERAVRAAKMSVKVRSADGVSIYHFLNTDAGCDMSLKSGRTAVRITLGRQKLYPGEYYVGLWLASSANEPFDYVPDALKFWVAPGGALVTRPLDRTAGVVHEVPEWRIETA